MGIIKRWNEYMGPKDERVASEESKGVKIGYVILLVGSLLSLYYAMMLEQVSLTTDNPIFTPLGNTLFPVSTLLVITVLASGVVMAAYLIRNGIIDSHRRYAQVERIPWGYVSIISVGIGLLLMVLTCGMRIVAEIQIVGIGDVAWFGDIAMGVVYFFIAFWTAFVFLALSFKAAIDRRKQLEAELDD